MRLFLALLLAFNLVATAWASVDIPHMAYKLRPQVIKEVRFWWCIQEPTSTFHAQIHQESCWDPEARSNVGAMGLAQFMPSTADWISKLYPKELGENQPLDVRWAIRAMVVYDKWLYDRIDSDERWPMSLSSYNGGLGNLKKDIATAKANGSNERRWWGCVENFSNRATWAFKENRQYVYRILKILEPIYRKEGF